MSGRILVTFGSKRGGTAELARTIAELLRERGCDVDCRPAGEVDELAPALARLPPPPPRPRWLIALCAMVAVTAFGGGLALVVVPDGSLMGLSVAQLDRSPFASFLVPGLILFGVVGLGTLAAAIAVARRTRFAPHLAFAAGAALLGWMTTEMVMVRGFHILQPIYQVVAAAIVIGATQLGREHGDAGANVLHA